jgi:hypothetical protein
MSDKQHILKSFGKYSLEVADLLKRSDKLVPDDHTFIENHVLIVQMAITMAKYGRPKKPSHPG